MLRFLYGVVLKQADLPQRIRYARERQKLPVVLGADEVVRFLEAVPNLQCRAVLTAAYEARLSHLTWQGYYRHDSAPTSR